jgi:hypothetical protein
MKGLLELSCLDYELLSGEVNLLIFLFFVQTLLLPFAMLST